MRIRKSGSAPFVSSRFIITKTYPIQDILNNKIPMQSDKLKVRLIKEGYLEEACSTCGREDWNSKTIPLQLSHKNGNPNDNSLRNLELLCPNCHAQTGEWKLKNEHRGTRSNVDHNSPNTDT